MFDRKQHAENSNGSPFKMNNKTRAQQRKTHKYNNGGRETKRVYIHALVLTKFVGRISNIYSKW